MLVARRDGQRSVSGGAGRGGASGAQGGATREQGSTKLLSLLSKIIETPKSGRNFFHETSHTKLKQMYYRWQSCFCHRKLFLSQKQVLSKKEVSVTETSFCQRNKFLSQKQVSVKETSFCQRNKFLSQRQVSV